MVINNLEASLTNDARVVIYDRNMFIVQSTGFILRQQFETQASLHQQTRNQLSLNIITTILFKSYQQSGNLANGQIPQ